MKPSSFVLSRPAAIEECLNELAAGNGKVLAGGQSLVPLLNLRLASLEKLVDINRIAGLEAIRVDEHGTFLGALVRHRTLETSPLLHDRLPIVGRVASQIGFLAIRNRGTLGGSLAHADPAAELPALMMLLDARVGVCSAERGRRELGIRDLIVGMLTTSLDEDELLVDVTVPWPGRGERHGFWEFSLRTGDFARVGALVKLTPADQGDASVTVVLFGSELPGPFVAIRALGAPEPSDAAFLEAALECCDGVGGDSESNLTRWASTVTRRAVKDALSRALPTSSPAGPAL